MHTATPSDVAAIFDLDGLLIDSEPLWVQAEREIFGDVGLLLSPRDCARTTGLRIDQVAEFWWQERGWSGPEPRVVAARIVDAMAHLLATQAQPLPGALDAVDLLGRHARLALASSSDLRLIHAALGRLGLDRRFEVVCSAETEAFGKPHPGVYLSAAAGLGLPPTRCIALEDSLNGVIAAAAARMGCIAVPDGGQRDDPRFELADVVLSSLSSLTLPAWQAVLVQRGLD